MDSKSIPPQSETDLKTMANVMDSTTTIDCFGEQVPKGPEIDEEFLEEYWLEMSMVDDHVLPNSKLH